MLKTFMSNVYSEQMDNHFIKSIVAQKIKYVYFKESGEFLKFIEEEPEFKTKEFGAYICGLIELLCNKGNFEIPNWVLSDKYFLEKPYSSLHGYLRVSENLIKVTSEFFSKRNYFTNEDGVYV